MSDDADVDEKAETADIEPPKPADGRGQAMRRPWKRRGLQSARTLTLDENATIDTEPERIHTRWLPIVSGLISPFAILLEISGLVTDWRVETSLQNG